MEEARRAVEWYLNEIEKGGRRTEIMVYRDMKSSDERGFIRVGEERFYTNTSSKELLPKIASVLKKRGYNAIYIQRKCKIVFSN